MALSKTQPNIQSALYTGDVRHRRLAPRKHAFSYSLMQWWLALDELEQVGQLSKLVNTSGGFAAVQFRASDYLRGQWGEATSLSEAVLNKINQLHASETLQGRVFFLGNLRCFGIFFSPINCYFLQQDGRFTHMLAEVSNTPWNQRHYYLVDLAKQADTEKAFHVSPFNPMDMQYQWKIAQPGERAFVHIEAHRQGELVFDATMALKRIALNRQSIRSVLKAFPIMSVKIVWGIYWQAMKLLAKRVPIHSHPNSADGNNKNSNR